MYQCQQAVIESSWTSRPLKLDGVKYMGVLPVADETWEQMARPAVDN